MASFEIVGNLKVKGETTAVSEKFSKREFVLITEMSSQYPQYISLQLTQEKCALLDNFQIGDEMKVSFNLRGREWNGPQGLRYFNSLEAWRLEKATAGATNGAPVSSAPIATPGVVSNAEIVDDLPF
ncbi:MAG: DUF3127 domain-containing protein [Chitinophagaceae bacterium]|nr:DUF3127 domain-containing protein [Chitinophagaceae bacterium]